MATTTTPKIIESHVLYMQSELCKRMGWGRRAYDEAVRRGLPVMRSGKRVYAHGQAVIEWVQRDAAARQAAQAPSSGSLSHG